MGASSRARYGTIAGVLVSLGLWASAQAADDTTLRIAITAADVPLTTGQTDNGAEGMRFLGYTIYDALVLPMGATATEPMAMKPGLATSWGPDPSDSRRWLFKIRPNVKFHDGSIFTAEAAVWNLDKILNRESPQYDPKQAAQGRSRISAVKSYRAVDPATLEISTEEPNAYLPYQIEWVLMSSPAQWEKLGKSWEEFAKSPSGTGPWKLTQFVPHERAVLARNEEYWNQAAKPALERMLILPVPDATARIATLRSGQVDWIEQPAPDSVASLKSGGFAIVTGPVLANWDWTFNRTEGSPWNDVRVRKAANLAIDRQALADMLSGLILPATGFVPPSSEWYGNPTFAAKYDPAEAKRLMAEAGYGPGKPLRVTALVTAQNSGIAEGMTLNQAIQQDLAKIGIDVSFDVMEWNTLLNVWRSGSRNALSKGAQVIQVGYFLQDPFAAFERHVKSDLVAPNGTNWGYYTDPEMDRLLSGARLNFNPAEQNKTLIKIHEKFVDEALFLFLVHDLSAIALSPRVQGYSHPKNTVIAYDWSKIRLKTQ